MPFELISATVVDDPTADVFQPPTDWLGAWWDSSLEEEDVD